MNSFVTNGEHDQMMRDQQRDLCRIADALERANQLKLLELTIFHEQAKYIDRESREDRKTYDMVDSILEMLAKRNGYIMK